jgi:hexokinase
LTRNPNGEIPSSNENLISDKSRVTRTLEKSWPIGEQLKHEKAEDLFAWIGDRIAEVVEDGLRVYGETLPEELPLGVTFSFPMM